LRSAGKPDGAVRQIGALPSPPDDIAPAANPPSAVCNATI